MYDTDTTYYISSDCLDTENATKSPYDDFDEAYVVVTYNGQGYDYYWTSVDKAGQGIKNIIRVDMLNADDIESDLTSDDISTLRGIDERSKTIVIDKNNNCQKQGSNTATMQVNGKTGEAMPTAVQTISGDPDLMDTADARRYVGPYPKNYVKFNICNENIWT